ncbi:MAG: hypothetical protein ACI9CD_000863 [Candidatus Deianiraeaceae bacterium]|jgi:hypothetical protein
MKSSTVLEMRNKAMFALNILCSKNQEESSKVYKPNFINFLQNELNIQDIARGSFRTKSKEISNYTHPQITQLFSLQSQQKNLHNGDLEANHLWFGKSPKHHTPKYNEMKGFIKRMIEIIDRYLHIIENVDFGRL